jgi:alkanesulfonate monooxygenase SsuD/methylene tetrahydromethanopterin reductase-like flavin-dependent oxidoreductase (luciferase family)
MTPTTTDFEYPRIGIVLPEYADKSADWLVEYAEDAVANGFNSVWVGEGWGYNPFALLNRVAECTDCGLGTCIANVFARSPAALAANALALHDVSDGQFVLGLGASTPMVVEGFHGQSFERPLRRIRETIEIVDLALAGERIEYDGEVFDVSGFKLNHADEANVPVLNAALGTTNIAMSIDFADGLLPHLMPLPAIGDAITEARERANRDRELHVAPSIPTAVSDDPEKARSVLASHVAYYAGSTDFYNDVIADHGFPEEAAAIQEAWRSGDKAAAADAVTPELQNALGIAGTPEQARERVNELLNGIVDTALISFPQGASDEMFRATIEALPPVAE